MVQRIQVRRGTAAQWAAANPVLADGEPGLATDTGEYKIGDGVTAWTGLSALLSQADASSTYARVPTNGQRAIGKGELVIDVTDYGALGDGVADDTGAFNAAIAAAVASGRELWVPGGTYLVEAPILVQNTSDFHIHMEGRLKRKNSSTRNSLLSFKNVTGLRARALRTDGNVMNNGLAQSDSVVYPVDEAKHDVRIEGCTDVEVGLIDSRNPAGDTLYVAGSSTRVTLGRVSSVSDQSSGRNAVSLISCSKVNIGTILSVGTGCKDGVLAMPGGFDIEPNSGQTVTDVHVGRVMVETSGASGLAVFGIYPSGGVRQIKRVKIGEVTLVKTAGVKPSASDIPIRGVDDLTIGRITHSTDAGNANQALAIDDSSSVDISVDIPRNGNTPVNIGATANVDLLTLRGRIGASGSHCLQVFSLTNATIDMRLKNPPNGSMLVSKSADGTSSNVVFSGDWRKDATGSWAMNIAASVTGWRVDRSDWTGWPGGGRMMPGVNAQAVERFNVKGLTTGTAAPTTDWWGVGQYVENTNPSELGTAGSKYVIRGWVCTVAGNPGTWLPVRALTGN